MNAWKLLPKRYETSDNPSMRITPIIVPAGGNQQAVSTIAVCIIPSYYVWHLRTLGRLWMVPDGILLQYGSVV